MGAGAAQREKAGSMTMDISRAFDLKGKTCVVTGGGRGIGRAIAEAFAQAGARVAISGRNAATLANAVRAMTEAGGEAHAIQADISLEADVERLASEVKARFGAPHVLVNNAGVNAIYKTLEDTTLDEWSEIIGTNLTGVFLACRAFGRQMLEAGRGSVISISSVAGRVGLAKTGAYCASKGGLELLTKSVAIDWAKRGVRINTVSPGFVETDLTSGLRDHAVLAERILRRTPMNRFAGSEEIVGAVLYLASDASSYVTGQTIGVDGGWTAA